MLIATNQGRVRIASAKRPLRHCSRFHAAVRQPHHQASKDAAAIEAGPTGPLTRMARLRQNQNSPARMRDGRFPSSQRQNWQPRRRSASVASVVASFDSATAIGAVARIKPANPPLAPEHSPAEDGYTEDGRRAGERRNQSRAERIVTRQRRGQPHQPVDQNGLVIARLAVEGREDPVAALAHFPNADGVPRLVTVPQARLRVSRQVEPECQERVQHRLEPGRARLAPPGAASVPPPDGVFSSSSTASSLRTPMASSAGRITRVPRFGADLLPWDRVL